jgi:glycosyltransferase involved in cell wall biosynthesis
MQILFVIANNTYCPYFSWFAAKVKDTPDVELSFLFLNTVPPVMTDELEKYGCKCYWLPFDCSKRGTSMLKVLYPLFKLLKKIKPAIVHTQLFDDSLPVLIVSRFVGIKFRFITKQDTFFHWNFKPNKVKYDKINNYNATHIIAVSGETKEFIIEKENADIGKVRVIHHGIYPDDILAISEKEKSEMRKRFKLDNKIVITTVARYIEWKGYKVIIEAAKTIVERLPNVKFLFIGYGDQKEELQKLVNENGLSEYINITGVLPRHDVTIVYTISNIYLHAALNEPFGFVIAEAMMYGLPVISTNTGAARDAIKHKENGYLIYERTPGEIAKAVIDVLHMENYKILGERAQKTAHEMYHFDVMWKKYIGLYRQTLRRS